MVGLIGRKVGMTRMFDKDTGASIPITVIDAGTNIVHQVKTRERDGYRAVQLGFGVCSEGKLSRPVAGHFKKLNSTPTRLIKEFRLEADEEDPAPGQKVGVDILENVKYVDVTGTTKGRGFSGPIRRHQFKQGRQTHGNTNRREPGSTGNASYPSRVFPGKRMAGQYGNQQRTAKGLEVVGLEKENGLIYVKGAVPGSTRSIVFVRKNSSKK
jgi:large subunit ribosomal protein L3